MEAARGRRLHHPAAPADHSGRRAGHPDRRRSPPVPRRAASAGVARARRHLRAGRKGARAVRRQHRRRLHRPAFARISDPQYRPHHQPRRPAQHGRGAKSTAARSICGRSRPSSSRPSVKRGDAGYMGKPGRRDLGREAAERRHRRADARDRAGADRTQRQPAVKVSRPTRFCSGRPISSRPRFGTCRRVLIEAAAGRRRRAVRLSAELAHHGDFADGDSGLDPDHGCRCSISPGCRSTR